MEAHERTLKVAVGLAAVGFRVLEDAEFAGKVSECCASVNATC